MIKRYSFSDGFDDTVRNDYERDGALVFEGFASPAECQRLSDRIDHLVSSFEEPQDRSIFGDHIDDRYFMESGDKVRFFFEKNAGTRKPAKALNKIGHALHDIDPVFSAFFRGERFRSLSELLLLHEPRLLQSMVIFKQPNIGGAVGWHQDATFLRTIPESVTGFWIALEDATTENGCLNVIPGGHKGPLRRWFGRGGDGDLYDRVLDETPFDETAAEALEVEAGTLIVFHGRMPHMSRRNSSDKSRIAVTLHVIDGFADYPADNWLQRAPDMPLRGFT